MKHIIKFIMATFMFFSLIYADNFVFQGKNASKSSFLFTSDELNIMSRNDGYSRLSDSNMARTMEEGMPELPLYTTFFKMEPGISYSVSYNIISSSSIENIDIFPSQGEEDIANVSNLIMNSDYYSLGSEYPSINLTMSEPMVMRDIEVGLVTFIPFKYDVRSRTLHIFDEVEIEIVESGEREINPSLPDQRSLLFEPMYKQMIPNYESLESRDDYQASAILYICGGSSLDHPYVEELIEWRKKQGYVVYAVSTSEVGGSSTNSVGNYIDNAYENFEPAPEIVGLIGDTGGSYPISTYNIQGGAGDNEYAYIQGSDFLPEIFIGRISVSSSSDISNIINKTLVYEKAASQNDYWYERAALVGDPSSSGISTITTNQYIENVMESHGMTDIETNYGNGGYNSFVDEAFDDDSNSQGILYYHYRGYYGSSSISVSGMDSGAYAPFAATITCGTGDFDGTSDSENFIRTGSVSSPKGAVACVGVSTLSTHTMYNNIVSMGIFEGIFSNGMYHAGAALANGKLALLRTYPTNPYSCVTKFSQWPNLMGDPALHLWANTPKNFIVDYPAEIPSGVNSIDVTVQDENGEVVEGARVVLLSDNDDLHTKYTDSDGNATISWIGNMSGEVDLNVFKNDFRLYEGSVSLGFVNGPALYLDQTRLSVSDFNFGNGDEMLNAGESVDLDITLNNLGSESATGLSITTISENEHVTITNGNVNVSEILSEESIDFIISISISDLAIDAEGLDIALYVEDINGELWIIDIPINVYASKLDINSYAVIDSDILEPGKQSVVELIVVNSGSVSLEDAKIELISSSDINFGNEQIELGSISVGDQILISNIELLPSSQIMNGTTVTSTMNYYSGNILSGISLVTFTIGSRDVDDPTGPDEYGYYIFDSGDTDYPIAPEYDWTDISQIGTSLGFEDDGNGCESSGGGWYSCDDVESNDVNEDINLPFDFKFYGQTYTMITVSSNGYISFADNDMAAFRNYSIPGAGGPSPMVAAFWDDLKTDGGGQVYKYVTTDYVIIQWDDMRTYQHNDDQNFQIIIYNPETMGHATPTGDGEIIIQYQEFQNTTNGDYSQYTPVHGCYSTVGIENHLGNGGLQYTFDDEYSEGSREISNGSALLITTSSGSYGVLGDLNQDEILNVLDIVITVNIILSIIDPTTYQEYAADINADGTINVLDVVQLVNLILDN